MNCPHQQGTYMYSCKSSRDVYVPSAFELTEYCGSTGHRICRRYSMTAAEGMPGAAISPGSQQPDGAGKSLHDPALGPRAGSEA